jgi:hypothetical protein
MTELFTEVKLRLPDGTVTAPPEPIAVEDPDSHDFLDHLVFDWNSMGGLFTLCELKIGNGASVAATHSDCDGYSLVALIEPDTQNGWSAYYRRLFLTNGAAFGFGLFGSLPREIVNYKPDLLADDLVRDAMWDNFQVLEAEDHDGFQSSLGEIFERMPPLDQDGRVGLLNDCRRYPHREDSRGGDGTSRLERRWLFDWYWRRSYRRTA